MNGADVEVPAGEKGLPARLNSTWKSCRSHEKSWTGTPGLITLVFHTQAAHTPHVRFSRITSRSSENTQGWAVTMGLTRECSRKGQGLTRKYQLKEWRAYRHENATTLAIRVHGNDCSHMAKPGRNSGSAVLFFFSSPY